MLKLGEDILILIFKELNNDDDRKDLLSCLLVNKCLFKLSAQILWKCPWKYFSENPKLQLQRRKKLLEIVILHLPETSRSLLTNEHTNIIFTKQQRKLSFNYISFCQHIINFQLFFHFVFPFNNKDNKDKKDKKDNKGYDQDMINMMILLEKEFYKLLINKCFMIKHLNSTRIKYPIHLFPGANTRLSNLSELDCVSNKKGPLGSPLFYGLAQICRFIEKITIHLFYDDPGLAELIKMQVRIKHIRIRDCKVYEYRNIVQALKKHAHALLHLNLSIEKSFLYFPFPRSRLINLQTLILCNQTDQNEHYQIFGEHLVNAIHSNLLQVLELDTIPLYVVTKIIQNTNGNLLKIKIRNIFLDYSKEYIQAIYKYCPNIKCVSIYLNNQNMNELGNLLIKCRYLEAIDVNYDKKDSENFDGDKFLNLFVKLAPISLHKVHIGLKIFDIQSLRSFFNNWNNSKGRKPLHLYDDHTHKSSWSELIKTYKIEGAVGFNDCKYFWN